MEQLQHLVASKRALDSSDAGSRWGPVEGSLFRYSCSKSQKPLGLHDRTMRQGAVTFTCA